MLLYSFSLEGDGTLLIAHARQDHEGRYQCMAKNVAGVRASQKVNLEVQGISYIAKAKALYNTEPISPENRRWVDMAREKKVWSRTLRHWYDCRKTSTNRMLSILNRSLKHFSWLISTEKDVLSLRLKCASERLLWFILLYNCSEFLECVPRRTTRTTTTFKLIDRVARGEEGSKDKKVPHSQTKKNLASISPPGNQIQKVCTVS